MSPLIVCTICLLMKVAFIKSAMMQGSPYRDFRASLVKEMNDLASKVGSLRTVNGISELQCTTECANIRDCSSFVYNIKSGVCQMHQTRLTHSSDQVYQQDGSRYYLLQANDVSSQSLGSPKVVTTDSTMTATTEASTTTTTTDVSTTTTTLEPSEAITTTEPRINCTLFPTYSLNTEFSVCYMVDTSSVNRADAMADCRADHPSAHMITLLNTNMMDFFIGEVGGDFWIDGNHLFQTWEGKAMPWESWCGGKRPGMGTGYTVMVHKSNRCMEGSSGSKRFVCQID